MSTAADNQTQLYQGYDRIAKSLGAVYSVYHFDQLDPLDSAKLDFNIDFAFSADQTFLTPLKFNKPTWFAWADGLRVSPNDFLVGPYGTFYIADKQPMVPMQAVLCNKTIHIGRGIYSTSGPIEEDVVNYATNLPAFMQFNREDIQKPNIAFGQQVGRAITHWTAFIPGPKGMILQDDLVTDVETDVRYIVDAPDFTNMGYVVHLRLATV